MKPALFERLGEDFASAFGASVTLSGSFGSRTVTAIFRAFRVNDALSGEYAPVETPRMVLAGKAADLEGIEQDDTVTVDSAIYRVVSVTDDGRAMLKLFLADGA